MSCPICSDDTSAKYRPFCSKRCADIDLAKWMNGSYAVPSMEEPDPEELEKALLEALKDDPEALSKKPH